MAKTKKTQGKLARYVNTLRGHGKIPPSLRVVAIIEGGVRFPIDPFLADFLDYFRISPTQISPNIFRIVNGVAELNRRLGFNLTVHDIVATYFRRTTQHEAFSLRPRDVNNTLVNGLPDTNKEMTDDFLLVRGNWYFPGHRCPTKDGKPEEKKKQIQSHLTDPVALQAVYDSEVCVDEYANPRSAYKLLRYIPSARSFLQCRQVSNLAEALANPANKSPPAHDIRDMAGINLKEAPAPPTSGRDIRTYPPTEEEAKGPVLPGVDTLPSTEDADVEMVGPFIPERDPISSGVLALFWAPPLEAQGERVRADATVLRTGGSGSSTASALCEVARLPVDMDVWRKSTNQEVINNLRRGLMMAVQGSLEIGERFQRQTADLENSLRVATRSVHLKSESERMRREVEAYKEQVRIATLKKDEADLKLEDAQDLLRNALEENSKAGERIQALEAEIAAREKAAFNRGSVEAQTTMTKQLPGIYNEAFQVGWKALYSWESDDMPPLPPQEVFPYPNAPIGVPEEELPEPQPADDDVAGPSNS
uniref:Transposase (putative) gypsy type domain-containing protein n=1 Tax=Fagus sylvatica TaxID=28930 RepID=A0A2N9I5E2_FAGSY